MALVVEIHVPMADPVGFGGAGHPAYLIDRIEDLLVELDEAGELEYYDDGEDLGEVFVFFVAGASEAVLLDAASRVARLDGVPAGAFAMVTDDQARAVGLGRRVDLPVTSR